MEDCLNDIEERKYTSAKFSASSWTIVITSFDFVIDNVWGDVVIYVEITKLLGKKIPSSRYNDYMLTTTPDLISRSTSRLQNPWRLKIAKKISFSMHSL